MAQGAAAAVEPDDNNFDNMIDDGIVDDEDACVHHGAPDNDDDDVYDQGAHAPVNDENDADKGDQYIDDEGNELQDYEAPPEQNNNDKPRGENTNDTGGYALRPRNATRTGNFKLAMDQPHSNKSYYPPRQFIQNGRINRKVVFEHVLTQMSAKAAIRIHGKAAEDALMAKFARMDNLEVYEPVDPKSLSKEQNRGALRAINLVKQKRCGKLKGRTVADG
jgi:hypothetical protein